AGRAGVPVPDERPCRLGGVAGARVSFEALGGPTSNSDTFLTVAGLRARVVRTRPPGAADAPTALAPPGCGASIDAVGSILAGLRDRVELVALDFPGFGRSDMVPAAWTVGDYARFVAQVADELAIDRFAIVAHSFGARVALVLATEPATRD